jgi:dihydroorotate dehydrogenase electron transfer subunit
VSNPLHARHYADRAIRATASILENVRIARDTYRVRFECPEIARRIVPGQFLMLRLAGLNDPLLGRPLALYDTVVSPQGEPIGVDVVYLVLGKFTQLLAESTPGAKLEVWGPLGNGFAPATTSDEDLVMVAGGIGQTPFMALARESLGHRSYGDPPRAAATAPSVTLCYGARTASYFAGIEAFRELGVEVLQSTDDGSLGHRGFVTELLQRVLERGRRMRIACCGPEPMMEAVSQIAIAASVPCQVSLETPMACGIGICFSCVARVYDETGEWDYKRTCVEGPIFAAEKIRW